MIIQQSFAQNTFPTTGNVGIGTTSPKYSLDISIDNKLNPALRIGKASSDTSVSGNYSIRFGAWRDVDADFSSAIVATPIWTCCNGYPQSGYAGVKANKLSFYTGFSNNPANPSTPQLTLTPTGAGIFNTNPTERLDITGSLKYSQLLKPNGITGTDKQVLMNIGGTSNVWTTLTTTHLSDFSTEMAKYLKANGGALTGNITLPSDKTLTFNDKTGVFPTTLQGGIAWDLNQADKASIYAYQPTADNMHLVFQIADDGADKFVFKRKDWNGPINDVYHLYMDDNKIVFNYPDLDGTTGTSKNMDFYIMGNGQPNKNISNPIFKTVASTNRIGINNGSPQEALDINGGLRFNGKLRYGISESRTENRDDAGLKGEAGAQSGFFQTQSPVNYPKNASGWWHLLDIRNSYPINNFAMQLAGSFNDQKLFFRKTNNNPAQAWREIPTLDTTGALTLTGNLTLTGKLKYGANDSRTEIRDNAGLRGDAGAQSGFFLTQNPVNYPKNASGWWHLLDVRAGGTTNNYAMQFSGSFNDQKLFFRKVNDNPAQAWVEVPTIDTTGRIMFDNDMAFSKKPVIIGGTKYGGAIRFSANSTTANNRNLELGNLNNSGAFSSSVTISSENGNVSIGSSTIQSAYKLAVTGDMIAERVVVKLRSTWPDYVFSTSYKLPALKDIEEYIKENHHLPNIPSAGEVEKNGVDVGDISAKLLKKIEELTMYLIQVQKTNDIQAKEIEFLKKELLKINKE
ncbi:hypothetical protein [Arcicella rosea]|uniref:Chaperone of endosialidase n=1 Tax=Arcicella rosea TaxID=502909 RepID=A0A841EVQ5_9BACT|nr:hypothetical protein [Arcicella rosea]MBB6005499.1 hypothetical protein [Arcicella rosea]